MKIHRVLNKTLPLKRVIMPNPYSIEDYFRWFSQFNILVDNAVKTCVNLESWTYTYVKYII